eukprot:EC792102.1.p3 GENE.EC792102.1~~EC792102.1.p3  ORF type:complete len:78 (+),score=3.92 EC792102.1:44-277(+)
MKEREKGREDAWRCSIFCMMLSLLLLSNQSSISPPLSQTAMKRNRQWGAAILSSHKEMMHALCNHIKSSLFSLIGRE